VLAMHGSPFYREVPLLDAAMDQAIHETWKQWKRDYPALTSLSESGLRLPGTFVTIDGLDVTESHCQCLGFYKEITEKLPPDLACRTILEIGSGFGRLARVFTEVGHCRCYVLVDLPESLLCAFAWLRINDPNAPFLLVDSPEEAAKADSSKYKFIFCPVQHFAELKIDGVDLVVNTWSFGEMRQGCIDHLLGVVERNIRPKYLFSANTIFQDRNLLGEAIGDGHVGQGAKIVLNVSPMWRPVDFRLFTSKVTEAHNRVVYRNGVFALLESVELPRAVLLGELEAAAADFPIGSDEWIKYAYFDALYTSDPEQIERFLEGLQIWMREHGVVNIPSYNFERIGEVGFLRQRAAALRSA
jgi:putative sugar O-methyltransferase